MTRYLALLVLVACGEPGPRSPCGVELLGSDDIEGFSAQEVRSVAALSLVPEFAGRDLCAEVGQKVLSVEVTPPYKMVHRGYAGSTRCWVPGADATIRLDGSYSWRDSSLTHEYAHVVIGCGMDPTHRDWGCNVEEDPQCLRDRKIFAAIELSRVLP